MAGLEVAIAVAIAGVELLLKEVFREVGKPWWEKDKNARVLGRLVVCMESVISNMDTASASPQQLRWLEEVQPCLQEISDALTKHEKSGFFGEFWSSRGMVQKLKQLHELCQSEVPLMILSNSNDMRKEFESIRDLLLRMEEQMEAMKLECMNNFQESQQPLGMATSYRHQNTYMTFGVEHDIIVKDAVQKLLEESKDDNDCVGIWGLGGSGKTLAAQRIFNDTEIQAHFTGGCYWMTVGNSKSNIPKLVRELWRKMGLSKPVAHSADDDIKNDLFNELKGRERMFVVLDDVWKIETLEILDVIPKGVHCKMLITTRIEDVLNWRHAAKMKMPRLSEKDSWKLFCEHAWRGDATIPLGLEEVGRQIASECGGLPLALKVIGGHLAGNNDPSRWQRTLEKLKNADVVSSNQDEQLYSKLQLSVDELDNDKIHLRLRDCLFYFAAFPEDFNVELKKDLLPLWLGDGIVGNNSKYDPMDEAKELLDELVRRSLIEMRIIDWLRFQKEVYVVHDVLRDLIRYMLEKVPLAKRDCLYDAGGNLGCLPEKFYYVSSRSGVTLSARCLSLMSSNVKELPRKFVNAPRLKVMILRGNPIEAISGSFFCDNFTDLRVLDLSFTCIRSLPTSLKNLKHLVVLNLSRSDVEKISYGFLKRVTNLEVLNVGGCRNLKHLPSSISLLRKLQYLHGMSFEEQDLWERGKYYQPFRGSLRDLMKLASLKELHIASESQKALPNGIFKALKHLHGLRLRFLNLVAIPEPKENELEHLQLLDLEECSSLTFLPDSFGVVVKNLHTLNLNDCRSLRSLPEGLAGLPKLGSLYLEGCGGLEYLPISFTNPGAFPVLKNLQMGLPSSKVSFPDLEAGAMPQLEHLNLYGWEQLVDYPKAISNLTKLRILDLRCCSNLRSLEIDGVGVQSLANLEELDVGLSSKISTLPDGLEELPKLRRIDILETDITFSQEVWHLVRK